MIDLSPDPGDAPEYVERVQAIVRGAAAEYDALDVHLVKINNWFGRKWLGFSHKLLGAVGVHDREDFALPGFVPGRVLSETKFSQGENRDYAFAESERKIHIEQMGSMNQYRRVRKEFPGAVFFWWSANTKENRKGALMCYFPRSEGYRGWYAGLADTSKVAGTSKWVICETAAISPQAIAAFVEPDLASG